MSQYIYTINSSDPQHYNRIKANLDMPNTEYSIFQITELTAKCSIIILEVGDYFVINGKKYEFVMDFCDLNSESFVALVDDMVANDGYYCEIDTASRIHFFADNEFELSDASYNVKILMGLHDIQLPLISSYNDQIQTEHKQELVIDSVGYTLSTPVLFLLSNIGSKTFKNNLDESRVSSNLALKTAMRITNAFSANLPIVAGNSDFETVIKSNDLSYVEFYLVDANLHEIKLLCPLYITIHVEPVPDNDYNIYKLMMENQNQNQN